MGISIKVAKTKKEMGNVFGIRRKVFIEEQKVPKSRELDGLDDKSIHYLMMKGNIPIGTARLRVLGSGKAKIERMAIIRKYRGKGFGSSLLDYIIDDVRQKSKKEIVMNAQCQAINFYRKKGLKERGKK